MTERLQPRYGRIRDFEKINHVKRCHVLVSIESAIFSAPSEIEFTYEIYLSSRVNLRVRGHSKPEASLKLKSL